MIIGDIGKVGFVEVKIDDKVDSGLVVGEDCVNFFDWDYYE